MQVLMVPGERHGRLTVISYHHTDSHYRKFWRCRCDCGGDVVTHTNSLRTGNTKSCGCLGREVRTGQRISLHHSEITAVILGYKRHALRRGLKWDLSRGDVEQIISHPCFYCGDPASNTKITKNTINPLHYNGIDRIDNRLGYTIGNVVPCCRICNNAKGQMTVHEFYEWSARVRAMAAQWGAA